MWSNVNFVRAENELTESSNKKIFVSVNKNISIDFKNTELSKALNILGSHSNKNIIISEKVIGYLTLNIKDAPWSEVFNSVLEMKNLVVIGSENLGILKIYTSKEAEKINNIGPSIKFVNEKKPKRTLIKKKTEKKKEEFKEKKQISGDIALKPILTNKNISYIQILQKPNDLKLNLKYARQQGESGNHKQTISTLERLIMLYPENVEIKLYLLSVLVQTDSPSKALDLINDIKTLSGLSPEDLDTIAEAEEYLKVDNDPKLWNFYADLSLGGIFNNNVNNVSNTGKKTTADVVEEFASARSDYTLSESLGLTITRTVGEISSLIFNFNGTASQQDEETTDDFNNLGLMVAYDTSFKNHGVGPYIMFSDTDNKTGAENHSLILGFGNYFLVNDKNTINYGFSYADENSDNNSSYITADATNSKGYTYNLGHDFILNKLISTSTDVTYAISDAKDATNDFENYDLGLRLNLGFRLAYVSIGNYVSINEYAIKDPSINSNILRKDLSNTTDIIATKAVGDIFPKYDPNRTLFFNVAYESVISESNILNYDYKTESMTIGLTKSIHLNK
ncbi:tetratricopeptide repeat protein [Pelagibacteraceae bacterium]|nr:tetratricopeptide repeat protein [Pelagibacteraceae bacterium]